MVSSVLLLLAKLATAGSAAATPLVTVGPNVQVSAAKATTMHGEGLIVADPTDAKRLLVCSMFRDPEKGEGVAVYVSEDEGAHWQQTFESGHDAHALDPACAFGPDGTAYLMMVPIGERSAHSLDLPLLRSDDGGHTWRKVAETAYLDRESLVVDGTTGRFRNRVYAHGTSNVSGTEGLRRSGVDVYALTDGHGFAAPAGVASLGRRYIFGMGNSVVLSDGRWIAVYGEMKAFFDSADTNEGHTPLTGPPPEPENAWLRVITSDTGGDALNDPVTVSGWHMPDVYVRMTDSNPTIAVDASQGPFRDRLYVVWPDTRRGGTDILLSCSADRGQTWSAPIVVNDDPRAPDHLPNHLLAAVAVNNAGIVAVTWLDRRDAPDNLGWRERIRVSLDGGETFEPSVAVAEASARFDGSDRWPTTASTVGGGTPFFGSDGPFRLLVFAPIHVYIPGDYAGLTADRDGVFHPYWIDNRTGWHQVWTAAVRIAGKAVRNGSASLAQLDDLTPLTTLERVRSNYDRSSDVVTMTVRLRNTSAQPLHGPFLLRALALDSQAADVEATDTANGRTGPGAVWDLSAAIDGDRLEPGAASRPVVLTFALHHTRSLVQRHVDHWDFQLVRLYARVLGHLK
jgi:hypothetical protein